MIILGLDPGSHTGFATWNAKSRVFVEIGSMLIHEAMTEVQERYARGELSLVIFEDARQRRWFGKMDREQAKYGSAVREGAGAAKRDAAIWADFLRSVDVPHIAKAPRAGLTKLNAAAFQGVTGWGQRTNEHARDAAMLVHGLNVPMANGLITDYLDRKRRAS